MRSRLIAMLCLTTHAFIPGYSQTGPAPPRAAIYDLPEAEQRRFVNDFLAMGAPLGTQIWNGYKTDLISDLAVLTRDFPWVIPVLEAKIKELQQDPTKNNELIRRLLNKISYAGNQQALDALDRIYGQDPAGEWWIGSVLFGATGNKITPDTFHLWYGALVSTSPMIRKVAGESLREIMNHPLPSFWISAWSEAMLTRYSGRPTAQQMETDPLLVFHRSGAPRTNWPETERLLRANIEQQLQKRDSPRRQ